LVIAGSFLVVFGMMMTSLATQYYQIILAQGLVVGLGAACLFTSSISNVQVYFQQQRALATGITSCGGSIGKYHVVLSMMNWVANVMDQAASSTQSLQTSY
jgi:nitrate/nitrite transporter NarK